MNCTDSDALVLPSQDAKPKSREVYSMNAFYAAPELDIAFNLGQVVEEVQAVFLDFNEENRKFTVLTIVPERDDSVCRKVYSVERDIIERYEGFDFAFSVLASNGREARSMVQDPSMYLAFVR